MDSPPLLPPPPMTLLIPLTSCVSNVRGSLTCVTLVRALAQALVLVLVLALVRLRPDDSIERDGSIPFD